MTKAGSVGMKRIAALLPVPAAVLIQGFDLKAPRNRCQVAGGHSFSSERKIPAAPWRRQRKRAPRLLKIIKTFSFRWLKRGPYSIENDVFPL